MDVNQNALNERELFLNRFYKVHLKVLRYDLLSVVNILPLKKINNEKKISLKTWF